MSRKSLVAAALGGGPDGERNDGRIFADLVTRRAVDGGHASGFVWKTRKQNVEGPKFGNYHGGRTRKRDAPE